MLQLSRRPFINTAEVTQLNFNKITENLLQTHCVNADNKIQCYILKKKGFLVKFGSFGEVILKTIHTPVKLYLGLLASVWSPKKKL